LLEKNLHEIDGKTVEIKEKINEKGHLFRALHEVDIVKAVKESLGADILPEFVVLEKPLKTKGEHKVVIKANNKTASVTISI
jgi:ribosomal protein L9